MTDNLVDIFNQVRAITEPDDELDAQVWLALVPGATRRNVMADWPDEAPIWEYFDPERNTYFRDNMLPKLTGNTVQAQAFLDRIFPCQDMNMSRQFQDGVERWFVTFTKDKDGFFEPLHPPVGAFNLATAITVAVVLKKTVTY